MADFVNPLTCALTPSANDMPAPWIVCARSDLTSWSAIEPRFRKWTGAAVVEMTAAEKSAVAAKAQADADAGEATRMSRRNLETALALVLLDEINALRTKAGLPVRTPAQLKAAVATKLGGL